jgi:hypothetical protein
MHPQSLLGFNIDTQRADDGDGDGIDFDGFDFMELAPEDLEKSLEELGIEWRKILMNKKWISRQGKRGKLGRLGK